MRKYFVIAVMFIICGVWVANTPGQSGFEGNFKVADCNFLSGFAINDTTHAFVTVDFFVDSTLVGSTVANVSLGDEGGSYDFKLSTPNSLKDGQVHNVSARIENSNNFELANSPRTVGPCVHPRFNSGTAVRLNVDLRIQNGAASTR